VIPLFISIIFLCSPVGTYFHEISGDSLCKITVHVRVIDDSCDGPCFEEIPGEPEEVYVYLCRPCGWRKQYSYIKRFEIIDTIPLSQSNEKNVFVGSKIIPWRLGILCVGYSPTNYINSYSVEKIQFGGTTEVHHWKCIIAITKDNPVYKTCESIEISSLSPTMGIRDKMKAEPVKSITSIPLAITTP